MTNQTLLAGLVAGQVAGNFHARAMQRMIKFDNDSTLNDHEKKKAMEEESERCIFNICEFANNIAMGLCAMGNLSPVDPPSIAMLMDDSGPKIVMPN